MSNPNSTNGSIVPASLQPNLAEMTSCGTFVMKLAFTSTKGLISSIGTRASEYFSVGMLI